jgi:putative peptidoglycan lipid II flippase
VSIALYKPLGIRGLVIGTASANLVMTFLQLQRLRTGFNGRLEGGQTLMITVRILVASILMAAVAWLVWKGLESLLGRSLPAEVLEVGVAIAASCLLYGKTVLMMRIPEARQIEQLVLGRLRGRAA